MRIFGIGKQTQWSTDTDTDSLRAVSVNTGKVLAVVTVQKTILSTADSATALKFFDQGTQAFEAEMGLTINEPGTYAVKAATEMAVVELIKEGQRKGIWDYRQEPVAEIIIPKGPVPIVTPVAPVISSEIKKEAKVEEKKDVVVQPQAVPETQTEALPPAPAEVKQEVATLENLPSEMILSEASFIYKEPDEKSQKTWQFKKGTLVTVIGSTNDWIQVRDAEKRRGFVKKDVLVNKQQ
jgi:curli production assembly/transport component CsgG